MPKMLFAVTSQSSFGGQHNSDYQQRSWCERSEEMGPNANADFLTSYENSECWGLDVPVVGWGGQVGKGDLVLKLLQVTV